MATAVEADGELFDVLGCGFGPSNLAVAAAITDKWAESTDLQPRENVLFIERHPCLLWHPGMLLPGSRMQISCLKDLVTLRKPTSPLTFLSYLHSQRRLAAFINRGTNVPTRREFADYLSWAAAEVVKLGVQVSYGEEVVHIAEVQGGAMAGLIEVTSRLCGSDAVRKRLTKNLILSAGGAPRLPEAFSLPSLSPAGSEQRHPIIHTSSYLSSIDPIMQSMQSRGCPVRVAIVGGGQSAAEVMMDVRSRLLALRQEGKQFAHSVEMIIRKGCLKPSDDSPFVNEIFDPDSTENVYNMSDSSRHAVMAEYRNTNYSVVNPRTLDTLYEAMYDQKLEANIAARTGHATSDGNSKMKILPYRNVVAASLDTDPKSNYQKVTLTMQDVHSRALYIETYDIVICATGYDRTLWQRLLQASNLSKRFGMNAQCDGCGKSSSLSLVAEHERENEDIRPQLDFIEESDLEGSVLSRASDTDSSSSSGTAFTSLTSSECQPPQTTIHITRNYRLLPRNDGETALKANIFLQGYAEATHGLSDTLLSVLGIRAGEVVDNVFGKK